MDTDFVIKQAFFKARKNILPDAFKELFLMTRDMVLRKDKIKCYKGYHILAIDGSELRLDKTKENKDIFLPRNHSPENKTNAEISLLEKFAGRSPIAVLQEYNAMMFILNCIAAMSATVNRKLSSSKAACNYQYRANVNLMIGYFKYRLSAILLFAEKALDICRQLILLCLKQPVPIIKGRSAPRPEFSYQRKVFCPKYSI